MSDVLMATLLVAAAALGLVAASARQGAGPDQRGLLRYQLFAVPFAATVWWLVRLAVSEPGAFARTGDLRAAVSGLHWMGVGEADTWLDLLMGTGSIIVVVTAATVWLQAGRGSGLGGGALVKALPLAIGLAVLNATNEELIFRVALLEGLAPAIKAQFLSATTAAALSGVLFGVPHWRGHPGGPLGVLLAGFLGWLSATATLQTGGIAWAWLLHVALDVVILVVVVAKARHNHAESNALPLGR